MTTKSTKPNVMTMRVLSRSMTTTGIRPTPRSANDHSRLSRFVVRQTSTGDYQQHRRPSTSASAPASTTSPTRSIDSLNIQVQSVAEIDAEDTPVPRNIRSVSIGSLYQRAASATTTTTGGTYKVLEYLHCGTTESSTDAALLCRLHITYIIGFSRSSNQHEHRSMPCACPKLHQRVEMQLDIGDNDASTPPDAIVACFDDVNRFIAAARSHAKQVLVFSGDARNSCQAFALQYIMQYFRMRADDAIAHLQAHHVRVQLTPNYANALQLWERRLGLAIDLSTSTVQQQHRRRTSVSRRSKSAWS